MKRLWLLIPLSISAVALGAIPTLETKYILFSQLPDPAFVDAECSTLSKRALKESQVLSDSVKKLCADYQAGKISEDRWIKGINDIEKKISPHFVSFDLVSRKYKVYCLFLVPSAEWKHKSDELKLLREAFLNFGSAIGEGRLAIWFLEGSVFPTYTKVSKVGKSEELVEELVVDERENKPESVDIERSKSYCDKFGLDYNEGPFVVVTRTRPDLTPPGDETIVLKLHDIDISRAVFILNVLEQDLRTERKTRRHTLVFEEVKQRILTAVDRHGATIKELATILLKLGR